MTTAEVALKHWFNGDWQSARGRERRRRGSMIVSLPDGLPNAPTYVYPGSSANGDVDVQRTSAAKVKADAHTRLPTAVSRRSARDTVLLGLSNCRTIRQRRLPPLQAYNHVGSSNIFAPVVLPADAALTDLNNTNSRERAVEGYASLQTDWGAAAVVRGRSRARLHRASERSDGSRAAYEQTVTTPWAGLAWSPTAATMLWRLWGQGASLEAVPNRPSRFVNYGEALPALKSEQVEVGGKWQSQPTPAGHRRRVQHRQAHADDIATASGIPLRVAGGSPPPGAELAATGRADESLSLQTSLMLLDATYTREVDPALVSQRVTNAAQQGIVVRRLQAGRYTRVGAQRALPPTSPARPRQPMVAWCRQPAGNWTLACGYQTRLCWQVDAVAAQRGKPDQSRVLAGSTDHLLGGLYL